MLALLRPAIVSLIVFTVVTGVIYPLVVLGVAQGVFANQANGSLIIGESGVVAGSRLIGQPFDDAGYFWSRLSATGPFPYNAAASSGSNYGPLNPALQDAVQTRIKALKEADPQSNQLVPVDLVTASASGLDAHVSVAAAHYQIRRVANARSLPEARVSNLVSQYTEGRQFGFLGEPRVNILKLKLALDQVQ